MLDIDPALVLDANLVSLMVKPLTDILSTFILGVKDESKKGDGLSISQ